MFYGQMVSRIFVENEVRSSTYSPMCFFTVPIPDKKKNEAINLIDCFDEFTKPEVLNEDNQWRDDNGVLHDAIKKIDIWEDIFMEKNSFIQI